jgi:hypothetical protein
MPQPDEVLHHHAEVVFLFHEKKLAGAADRSQRGNAPAGGRNSYFRKPS